MYKCKEALLLDIVHHSSMIQLAAKFNQEIGQEKQVFKNIKVCYLTNQNSSQMRDKKFTCKTLRILRVTSVVSTLLKMLDKNFQVSSVKIDVFQNFLLNNSGILHLGQAKRHQICMKIFIG